MIHVIASIELQPGTREKFLGEFAQLIPQVRAEVGCLEYGSAIDLASGMAAQIPLRPDVVTVVEKWTSLDTLAAHGIAPHMQVYREKVKGMVIKTTLQILEPRG